MKFNDEIYNNYEVYRKLVDALTLLLGLKKEDGDTFDHILPVSFGFNWKIPPNLIADKRNVQVIKRGDNAKKSYRCDSIPRYIQRYMIDYHHRTVKERQMEGIKKAKENGVYTGRKKGTKESVEDFLKKPKIQKVVEHINKGWKHVRIAEEFNVNINTVTKVKKILNNINL